jgi:hypothetical protein
MTRDQIEQARTLVRRIKTRYNGDQSLIDKLLQLLEMPPSLEEIINLVPGASLPEKAKALGVTRQALWTVATGKVRPSDETCERLANITGIPADVVRSSCP